MFYRINDSAAMLFFSGVRTADPLWALVDVYGLTRGVQLLGECPLCPAPQVRGTHPGAVIRRGAMTLLAVPRRPAQKPGPGGPPLSALVQRLWVQVARWQAGVSPKEPA